jgi:hypothetical protein
LFVFKDEFGSYWPEEGYASYGPINVGFEGKKEDFSASGFIVRNFKLTDTRVISLLHIVHN